MSFHEGAGGRAPRFSWPAGPWRWGRRWPWAALGLGVPRAGRTPFWWFVVLATAVGLLSTAVFFVVGRCRIPWIPGLALLAGAGAADCVRRLASRRLKGLAARVVLL